MRFCLFSIIVLGISAVCVAASIQLKNPNPETSSQIWQNDRDLQDAINNGSGTVIQSTQNFVTITTATTGAVLCPSGIKVTLTPRFYNSRIEVVATGQIRTSNAATDGCATTIYRNSTNLATGARIMNYLIAPSGDVRTTMAMSFIDDPVSKSSTTYEIWFRADAGGGSCVIGQNATTTIYAKEIGQ